MKYQGDSPLEFIILFQELLNGALHFLHKVYF